MSKSRLEAFSDGIFAIIITIMVLDLKIPSIGRGRGLAMLRG
ncbi:TMEM175 family protein [Weissella confusa]|nr:TMEM175 family protein [Weissella confusa]